MSSLFIGISDYPRTARRSSLNASLGLTRLVDTEIGVMRNGSEIRIALTGPYLKMTREAWRKWLEEKLKN